MADGSCCLSVKPEALLRGIRREGVIVREPKSWPLTYTSLGAVRASSVLGRYRQAERRGT
eukprot:scaffold59335_cov32-Phaeocystis_antarctica.AAC.1